MKYKTFDEIPASYKKILLDKLTECLKQEEILLKDLAVNSKSIDLIEKFIRSLAFIYTIATLTPSTKIIAELLMVSFIPILQRAYKDVINEQEDQSVKELEKIVGE